MEVEGDDIETKTERAADEIMAILEEYIGDDKKSICHLLFLLIMSYLKSESIITDTTNEIIAKTIVTEIDSSLQASFGIYRTREIWKRIFAVVKDMVSSSL